MAKIGRNDPCPCGSGKKYKQCHGPIDAARETEQRQLKSAPDTLLPKIMDTAPRFASEFLVALDRFWNGAYSVEAIAELDDIEERGAERFLTWFFFDHRTADGRTPLETLVDDASELELTLAEARLLPTWTGVRLQPYVVTHVQKGQGLTVRPLWEVSEIEVEDYAAARHIEVGDVLVVHLTPMGDAYVVAGSAARLTADTVELVQELTQLHLNDLRTTQPEAGYADLIRDRSQIFNHLVMALPREEQEGSQFQTLIDNARVMMATMASSLGMQTDVPSAPQLLVPAPDACEGAHKVTDGSQLPDDPAGSSASATQAP